MLDTRPNNGHKQKEKKMKKFVLLAVAMFVLVACQKKVEVTTGVDTIKVDTSVVVVDTSVDSTKK